VQPRDRTVVPTGIAVAVPGGTYGRVAPRSGLAAKSGIDVGAGVVDADYRGELKVVLFNHSDEPLYVKPGDRIAQLVLERIACASVHEVDDLDATDRSADGFGSTGA
jgi:dUTP pyrophosphatase